MDCIFCKMAAGEIATDKLYDDARAFAIRDINPSAPTHVLIIPQLHVGPLHEESASTIEEATYCMHIAPRIAQALGVTESGYRLTANQGPDSGQEVPHFHLHLLAGRPLGGMVH